MYNSEVSTIYEGNAKITIWSLALPLLIQSLLSNLIGTTGITVLSGYSEVFVTATAVAGQISAMPHTVLESLITGTVILSSVALGRRDKKTAASICGCGLVTVLILSVIAGYVMSIFADEFVSMMNLRGNTAQICRDYLVITAAIGFPIQMLFITFQKLLICNGHSKSIPISSITAGVLNAVLRYVVLYSIELPINDITALAIATIIAWCAGIAISVVAFIKNKCPLKLNFKFKTAFDVIRIGLPAGMCLISYNFSNTITTSFLADMGDTSINARIYINNIVAYVHLFFWAIASANAVIMGRHRGAERFSDMKVLFRQNLWLAIGINGSLSVLCFLLNKPLLSIFTTDKEILALAAVVMLVDIPLEIARGINHLAENSLNPNGDVKITLITSVISAWTFSVLLGYILCTKLGFGLVGLWIGFLFNESFKAVVYLIRWNSDKWKSTAI